MPPQALQALLALEQEERHAAAEECLEEWHAAAEAVSLSALRACWSG